MPLHLLLLLFPYRFLSPPSLPVQCGTTSHQNNVAIHVGGVEEAQSGKLKTKHLKDLKGLSGMENQNP